jgi:hypothetical protein
VLTQQLLVLVEQVVLDLLLEIKELELMGLILFLAQLFRLAAVVVVQHQMVLVVVLVAVALLEELLLGVLELQVKEMLEVHLQIMVQVAVEALVL